MADRFTMIMVTELTDADDGVVFRLMVLLIVMGVLMMVVMINLMMAVIAMLFIVIKYGLVSHPARNEQVGA